MQGNGTRRRSAVESCCARCRNATAVSRTQLKCSMKCRYACCWRTRGSCRWARRQGYKTPSGGCCDGVPMQHCADAARQGRDDAGPADKEEEEQQHEVVEAETAARI
jgi:hypothetical protein